MNVMGGGGTHNYFLFAGGCGFKREVGMWGCEIEVLLSKIALESYLCFSFTTFPVTAPSSHVTMSLC